MKKAITLAGLIMTSLTFNASAAMDPKLENTLISVCKTGLSDSIYRFNSTMNEYRIDKKRIFPNLVCNGESFHDFALSNGAIKVAKKIAPYTEGRTSITDIAMNKTKYSVNF